MRVGKQVSKGPMKSRDSVVLAHDPCGGHANLIDAAAGKLDDLGIPPPHGRVAAAHTVDDLRKGALHLTGMARIVEGLFKLLIRERAAKPSGAPEEKRHQDEEQCKNKHGV